MNIIVTGAAGFIGFHLANLLIESGYHVLGVDNINDYYDTGLKIDRLEYSGIKGTEIEYGKKITGSKNSLYSFIKCKLEDKQGIFRIFNDFNPDIVVNLAAQAGVRYSLTHPDTYISANIQGFLNVLEACRAYPVKHLLFASSSSVYGLNTGMPYSVHHHTDHPVSLYAASKKSNELMAHVYSHLYHIPSTGIRFFTVYGPWGRPDMALFIFTRAILNGETISVFNNGNMERDFTYIDDIVKGIHKMIYHPPAPFPEFNTLLPDPSVSAAPYRIYNIGNNRPVKLMDFIKAIENATGKKARIELMPLQPGDVQRTWADVNKLIEDFDYEPFTPIQTGVERFVSWYRKYYRV